MTSTYDADEQFSAIGSGVAQITTESSSRVHPDQATEDHGETRPQASSAVGRTPEVGEVLAAAPDALVGEILVAAHQEWVRFSS